ncbi:NACHT domain- and WD repeat-containing protein 1-like [Mytilus californianus]|uniref:NACHT domain- and WD repeat-containing protein 1-like n=1 Tax=Mytilus californianus TaxID=6549 RepID=UPI002248348B|nr:NACHT domain- and WD repeat-containing protein 1-like [Mytilus californianus]
MGDEANLKRILNGYFEELPRQEPTAVRVFFSSTFTDMTVEKNYMMKHSVPKIREYCFKKGLDFQIVDYCLGVKDEASVDHSTTDLILEEVEVCKKTSTGPYFVLFLGEKYGLRSLPSQIEATEYKTLYRIAARLDYDTILLSKWYQKDDNAEPAVFCLQPIIDILPNYNNEDPGKSSQSLRDKDHKEWDKISEKLMACLRDSADKALEENRITKDQHLKYFYSVLEAEALAGIVKSDNTRNRVLAYFRTFGDLNKDDDIAGKFTDLEKKDIYPGQAEVSNKIDHEAKTLRENLNRKVKSVLLPNAMKKDILYWTSNGVDPNNEDHKVYLINLDKHFERSIINMIDNTMKPTNSNEDDLIVEENLHHLLFGQKEIENFCGREEILEEIRIRMSDCHGNQDDEKSIQNKNNENNNCLKAKSKEDEYFETVKEGMKESAVECKEKGVIYTYGDIDMDEDSDPEKNQKLELIKKCDLMEYCRPVIVYGESGSGKTSIMAKLAELSKSWFPGCSTIIRFLGTSVGSSTLRGVLCSIIRQICKISKITLPSFLDLDGDFMYVTRFFESLLNRYESSQKLVIILDSINQLSSHDHTYLMNWLPLKLPKNIHLVVSLLSKANECLQNIQNRFPFQLQFIEVPFLPLDAADSVITKICQHKNRRVTKPQKRHLLQLFGKCGKPLYLKVLIVRALQWRSFTDVKDFKVGPTVHAAINLFFDELEKKYGTVVVEKCFGFFSACKEGLSHAELEDLLSLDDETLQNIYLSHLPPDPDNIRIPSSVMSQLIKDTNEYMTTLKSGGKNVIRWYHRQFEETSKKRYLKNSNEASLHTTLVDYFSGTWYNKPKPLELTQKKKVCYTTSKRGVPHQPLYYSPSQCNVRKLIELPYHLIKCHMFKCFHDDIACSFQWLYAKCKFVSVSSMVEDLKMALVEMDTAGDIDNTVIYNDIKTVHQMLSVGGEDIRKDNSHLAIQILGQLGSSFYRSSMLWNLVEETKEWSESCNIALLLPLSQCLNSPDGYMDFLIRAQVWMPTGGDVWKQYGEMMHLDESNGMLTVVEVLKDRSHDYLSRFDTNDNWSTVFLQKIEYKDTTSIHQPSNSRFIILRHSEKDGHYDKLIKSDTLAEVNIPDQTHCITASDKYVVYSTMNKVSVCIIGENLFAMSVIKSLELDGGQKVQHLLLSSDSRYLVVIFTLCVYVLSPETLEILYTDRADSNDTVYIPTHPTIAHITENNILFYKGIGVGRHNSICMFDLEKSKELHAMCHSQKSPPKFISHHPSHKYSAIVTDKRWFIHDCENGKLVSECPQDHCGDNGVTCLQLFGSDNIFAVTTPSKGKINDITIFYCGSIDSPLQVIVPFQSLKGHSKEINQLILMKDENTLYSASQDCTIRVWNFEKVITEFHAKYLKQDGMFDSERALEDYKSQIQVCSTNTVRISSDSKTVLLGKSNGHFAVKDLSSGECIHEQDYQKNIKMLLTSKSSEEIILIPETEDDIIILNSRTYEVKQRLTVGFPVHSAAEANGKLVVGRQGFLSFETEGKIFNIKDGSIIKGFQQKCFNSLTEVAINSIGTKYPLPVLRNKNV